MKSDPALLIAKTGYNTSANYDKLVMDTRHNIFHFYQRKDKGGDLGVVDDNFGNNNYRVIRHALGYPPFFIAWSYVYTGTVKTNMEEASEVISGAGDFYCDETNIYIYNWGFNNFGGGRSAYVNVGTYNLESPPDYTFHVS